MNLPSLVNIWTRRFSRSARYTIPSTRSACATLKCVGPSGSGKVFGETIAQLSSPPGGLPKAPYIRFAVTVRYEQFVGWRMDPGVSGAIHIDRVSIAFALVAFANLQHEFAVARELQVRVIGDGFEPSESRGWAIVLAHPDKALVVDMDAVFALGPVISACRPAPSLDEVVGGIEHDNRGRRLPGVFGLERARRVQEPDIVLRVDGEARRISELHLRRQLRPRRIDLKYRHAASLRR